MKALLVTYTVAVALLCATLAEDLYTDKQGLIKELAVCQKGSE